MLICHRRFLMVFPNRSQVPPLPTKPHFSWSMPDRDHRCLHDCFDRSRTSFGRLKIVFRQKVLTIISMGQTCVQPSFERSWAQVLWQGTRDRNKRGGKALHFCPHPPPSPFTCSIPCSMLSVFFNLLLKVESDALRVAIKLSQKCFLEECY